MPRLPIALCCAALTPVAGAAAFSPTDEAAIYAAAGFTRQADGRYVRCQEDTPTLSYTPGAIEAADLNGDGQMEAFVTESSMFCYGSPHTFFGLVVKTPAGWKMVLDDVGIPVVLESRHAGWADVQVGGPGFGAMPEWHFDGTAWQRVSPP